MLDLANKGFCIFGFPDGGKSTLANFLLSKYGSRAFVYDTLGEYPDHPFDSYAPKDRYDSAELEGIIRAVMASRKYSMFLIDEANRFCPSKPTPLPQAVADLNDWRAHYELAVGYIARRPVQLNQDLTELSHYLFIFRLEGKNDIQYLNDLADGLGDAVSQLPLYSFILRIAGSGYQTFAPVPGTFKTDKKM